MSFKPWLECDGNIFYDENSSSTSNMLTISCLEGDRDLGNNTVD